MNYKLTYTYFLIIFLIGTIVKPTIGNNLLHQADSLYIQENYQEALDRYRQVLNADRFLNQDFTINFKMGICYIKNKSFSEANAVFSRLKHFTHPIPEYVDYYLFLTSLGSKNPNEIIASGQNYIRDYPKHFFADSVRLRLADFEFEQGRYDIAYRNYARLAGKKKMKRIKPYLLGQMAFCSDNLKQEQKAWEGMYQVMKKYPSDPTALRIADMFLSIQSPSSKYEFAIGDVYLKHGHYSKLTKRLESFIKKSKDPVEREKARYYLIRIYYNKGQYRTALYGFKNLLPGLRDKSLESRIRLSIARSYLRLDLKKEAVDAYMDYAKRYPRRRMAVECTWKSNWIYEELGDISAAIRVNEYLLKHWPRSAYRKESKFRIGLLNLRLQNYMAAENIFRSIRAIYKKTDFHHIRSTYWLAKTYEKSGREEVSRQLFIDLGTELFESYYTLKSYMRFKSTIDTMLQIENRLSTPNNPLRFHTNLMAPLMERFEDLFLIKELLGDDLAMMELARNKHYPKTLKGWISVAEVYKRLGAYNEAFRIYDYIDKKYYNDITALEKPFLLKESYPLYYNTIIGKYGRQRNIDKNLVLALIRAESSFNRRAHSWADAYGLMQIIPRTAKSLAAKLDMTYSEPEVLFDPAVNIRLGTLYLQDLLRQFDGTFENAVAAYNAGPHRVTRWKKFKDSSDIDFFVENIEYTQTRNYTRRVMKNYWIYKMLDGVN